MSRKDAIRILTGQHSGSITGGFDRWLKEFLAKRHQIEVHQHHKLHDRYILFNDRCWLVGSSLKELGRRFSILSSALILKQLSLTRLKGNGVRRRVG